MHIVNIQEAGCSNILRFAIANGADIQNDLPLQGLIGNELFYLVTYGGVNFFELLRLTQSYREKLRVVNGSPITPVEEKEFAERFPGMADENTPMKDVANHIVSRWLGLALQMNADNELMTPAGARLFLPMMARKFEVQIPIAFADLVNALKPNEYAAIFNADYPATLVNILDTENINYGRMMLELNFVKTTSMRIYGKQLESYLNIMKYAPLRSVKTDKLYKFALSGFHKYDNLARSEVRFSMFQPNPSDTARVLKRMAQLSTPLITDWVIQMPIQYMQQLLNSYSAEDLPIQYESSASGIIDAGFTFHDFILPEESLSEEEGSENRVQNQIEAYTTRINECNSETMAAMQIMISNNGVDAADLVSSFSLLPSVYNTRGVISVDMSKTDLFLGNIDPLITGMFREMFSVAQNILDDLKQA